MAKKTKPGRRGAFNNPPTPGKPRSFEAGGKADVPAAFDKFATEVGGKVDGLVTESKATAERVELIDRRTAKFETSVHDKFQSLADDSAGRFAELGDRLAEDRKLIEALDEGQKRAEAMGPGGTSPGPRLSSAFAQELIDGKHIEKYRELAEGDKRAAVRFKMDNMMPFARRHGFAGESTVVIDDGLVGDGSDPVVRAGLTELIRDPIGLVDVINEVPGVEDTDAFKEMVEDLKSELGFVVCACNGAQDGSSTAVDHLDVHNSEGFIAGQSVYVWTTASGQKGPFTIVSTTAVLITLETDDIDFLVEDGSLVTGTEFAATAENAVKPAGVLSASLESVDIQTLATYVITSRQRLRRTNIFDLASWIGRRLPVRLREILEWHLLYGSGVTANGQLHGFLNTTLMTAKGVSTDTWSTALDIGGNRADLLLWAAANIPGNRNLSVVMHKLDWYKLTGAKDSAGNYVHGAGEGPRIIDTPALKAVGGLRVVLSNRIAQTYALVLDPEQASSFARMNDAEMVIGWVNDQMITNQQTILHEQSFGHLLKVGTAWRRVYFDAAPS